MGIKNIYISSKLRNNYTTTNSNNFNISLNESMYGSYKLKSVSVPNTMYTIQSGINNFMRIESPPGTPLNIFQPNVYITDGNTLAAIIQNTLATSGVPGPITVVYDNNTAKLTFSAPAANPFVFDFTVNYSTSLATILGFSFGRFSSVLSGANQILVSNQIVNFTRTPIVFIKIAEFNNYMQNGQSGVCYTYLLPNNVSSLYFIDSFFDQTGVLNQFAKELNISLRDENDRIIDIQNVDWYMVLESTC